MRIQVSADKLALGDILRPDTHNEKVIALYLYNQTFDTKSGARTYWKVKVAFQDPFTAPETYKEAVFAHGAVLEVERDEVVPTNIERETMEETEKTVETTEFTTEVSTPEDRREEHRTETEPTVTETTTTVTEQVESD